MRFTSSSSSSSSCFSILLVAVVAVVLACFVPAVSGQIGGNQNFDEAQIYWPAAYKRSIGVDGEMYAFPGLRGLRGKRDPAYNKRVPMMSLKGLRGKRARFGDEE